MEIRKMVTVFDAADPVAESRFWAAVLGGEIRHQDGDDWWAIEVDGANPLAVQAVPGHVPPDWPEGSPPQQMHVDLWVLDVAAAHEEVVGLGARFVTRVEERGGEEGWEVFLDPAGHPFCLCWHTDLT
jgi:hypothetical protein